MTSQREVQRQVWTRNLELKEKKKVSRRNILRLRTAPSVKDDNGGREVRRGKRARESLLGML